MSFLLPCPNCGPRDVNEFAYAGEVTERPRESPSQRELASYVYFRRNVAGVQREWWYHRFGCELWFLAELVATGKTPELSAPFALKRFYTDTLVLELAAAAVSH
jgi:heterotetrameric sarcosine oxidase delta subunit